jgi:hypothetical protein
MRREITCLHCEKKACKDSSRKSKYPDLCSHCARLAWKHDNGARTRASSNARRASKGLKSFYITCVACHKKAKNRSDSRFLDKCSVCANPERLRLRRKENLEASRAQGIKDARLYRERHPEEARARCRAYRSAHLDEARARCRAWTIVHHEEVLASHRIYYVLNKADRLAYGRTYYYANKEACDNRNRAYSLANPDVFVAISHRRRAKIKGALGPPFTKNDKARLLLEQKGLCFDCKLPFNDNPGGKVTIGHLNPIDGDEVKGSNWSGNIVLQCKSCNSKQGTKTHSMATLSLFDRIVT